MTGADSDAVSLVNSDNSLSNIPLFSNLGRTSRASSVVSSAVSTQASSTVVSTGEATSGSEFEIDDVLATGAQTTALSSKIAQAILNQRTEEQSDHN